MEDLIEEISSVDGYDVLDDFALLVGLVLGVPSLEDDQDQIPPVLHLELWLPDLGDLLESILEEYEHYDWTV